MLTGSSFRAALLLFEQVQEDPAFRKAVEEDLATWRDPYGNAGYGPLWKRTRGLEVVMDSPIVELWKLDDLLVPDIRVEALGQPAWIVPTDSPTLWIGQNLWLAGWPC